MKTGCRAARGCWVLVYFLCSGLATWANTKADSIWEGKLNVRIPELVRYVNGKREGSMKGVELRDLPVEIWFPTETTFSVIYVLNPVFEIQGGQLVGRKYFWMIGENVPPSMDTQAKFFGQGLVNPAKRTLVGTCGARIRQPAPDATMSARYTMKKSKTNETLAITGVATILYQRLDPEHPRYLLNPRPSTLTYSGIFTKTPRLVSEERFKTGSDGFGVDQYGPLDNLSRMPR